MEKKGLFKLPYPILIYEIPKYMELNDYINYTSSCKFLNNNFFKSDIWKRELYKKYTEDEILFAEDKKSSYEKFKKLITQTVGYKKCVIAHRDTHWNEENDFMKLRNVCWLHIIGKLDNVADGRYIPEFKVKFSRRPLGLNRLEFIASVIEEEIEQKYGKNTINENDTVHNTEKNSINENDTVQNTEKNTINENDTVEKTEKNNDSENSETQVNTNNIINNRTSLLGVVLSTLSFGYFKDIKSTHNTNNDNKKKELYSKTILTTQYKFNRNIINQYKKDEWCIVECPEIVINRSSIDPTKSKLIVKLEIKDINGYWKNGLSFKGMRLRTVPPSDIN